MSADKIIIRDRPGEPKWAYGYREALYFLSGVYGAEQVREAQQSADCRGSALSGEEISRIFLSAAKYMCDKIQRTSKTDGYKPCSSCGDSRYVYRGGGRSRADWELCPVCQK